MISKFHAIVFTLLTAMVLFPTKGFTGDTPPADPPKEEGESKKFKDPIDRRIFEFAKRIERGVEDGQLNKNEQTSLEKELDGLSKKLERYRSDDNFTGAERKTIEQDLNRLDKKIRREKHD